MRKVLLTLFIIVLFAAIYQVLTPILSSNPSFSALVVRDVLVVSLLIATLAFIVAIVALFRSSRIQKQTEDRLIAIDLALSDFANRVDVAALSMQDLARATHRDIVTMQQRMETEGDAEEAASTKGATGDGPRKSASLKGEKTFGPESRQNAAAAGTLRQMIEISEPRLSLQPIVDVIESRPIAFEAYASYRSDDQTIDIQRADELPKIAQSRLATALLEKSVGAARRLAGSENALAHPIHVPLSLAFLAEGDLAAIIEGTGGRKGLPDDLTLSLPLAALLKGPLSQPIKGWRPVLSCEADTFPDDHLQSLAAANIRWLKMPAKAVLVDGESERYRYFCEPLGIDVIVTHVHDKDEAVSLLDRGFRYMSGHHFGIPRPLRGDGDSGQSGTA